MAGGFCAISRHGTWTVENLTAKDHLRGALKSYRRECFKAIGGLKPAMGWDTADEILARYHGWEISTNRELIVKHLKPTGIAYRKSHALRQGEAFKNLRYGLFLTVLGALKLAIRKRSIAYFFGCVKGYFNTKGPYLLSRSEGRFLRRYRWRNLGRN
jgi:hypothetical protein